MRADENSRPSATIPDRLAGLLSRLLGAALIVAVLLNVANVVGRYVFDHALAGVDEIQVYLMIAIAFLGSLVAQVRRRHLRMDVLRRRFPLALRSRIEHAESLLTVAICGLMSWVSWSYTVRMFRLGIRSENADVAMWIPHSLVATSFLLMTLAEVARLFGAAPSAGDTAP